MFCGRCGNELTNGSKFCNSCGTSIATENNQIDIVVEDDRHQEESQMCKKDKILKNKKILIPILIICCLVVGVSITYSVIKPPSTDEVFNKIKNYNADDEISYLNKVYPKDGLIFGLFKESNQENKTKVLNMLEKNLEDEFKSETGRSISDYNAVKISKVEIEHLSYDSDYVNINVTVNNGGTTAINYIKINLYYKDSSGNIIRSEWTNDDSDIESGASQVITKMTENDGWDSVHAEIAEIH
jgi:hypothetical protein